MDNNILSMINSPTILSGMSHEMRTHMNSIVAFTFLMNNGNSSEEDRMEFSRHILSSCDQLMILFDNFLDSAVIDTGSSKAEPGKYNINSLVDELLSEFRLILKREELDDLVLIQENHAVSNTDFNIDANRVSRVIRTLFLNALSNTSSGYIKVGHQFRDGNISFYVLDSGHGFEKCRDLLQSENINEALQKYNDTTSAVNLTLARKLVHLMGGKIWIESNGFAGTGVYFTIPVRETISSQVSINKYSNTKIAI
ncbi:MAG TPA: HAMP domain-containing sensor histidine kinase [Bacteroidales bacterium]|nr:HAMP domain-containing sensor histidine kinase [Bacteroidales bacterium]